MATYKVVDAEQLNADMSSVADSIRTKGGTTDALAWPDGYKTAIDSIPSGVAKETWVIKSDAAGEFSTTQISFTSNGQKFTSIGANDSSGFATILYYDNNEIAGYDPSGGGVYEFSLEAYRKLTFDTPPTGALLTWLQSNAVKQPDDTAVQDTKALTITSNGTVSVTPDAPYDGLSSVDVTVNVSGGGGVENETCIITLEGNIPIGGFFAFTSLFLTPFDGYVIMPEIVYLTEGFTDSTELRVLKNSAFYIGGINEGCETKGSIVAGHANQNGYYSFLVTGDCQITVW